ncbi:MAG: glycosyltransferase [Thermoleophilaceae bacterium]
MTVVKILFWLSVAGLVHTHVTYGLSLALIDRLRGGRGGPPGTAELPSVSLIVPAHDEEPVIWDKVRNALALDYPRDRLELIVASDGSTDATAAQARAAGADVVLDLPRAGKVAAQDAAAERARGDILAFADANSIWARDALRRLVEPFADERVGYVCGQVRFSLEEGGTNEEGAYWRYEMAVRELESRTAGITAGNGAIYAVRRSAYWLDPLRGDLSFPFKLAKRGLRSLYQPRALAQEKMVPTIEGEFRRKRRMMSRAWGTVLEGGMLSPLGYSPLYAYEIFSHRILRYASPFLHVLAFAANIALLGSGWVYAVTFTAQCALLVAAALAPFVRARPLALAYYYVTMTASIAAGLVDWLRRGMPLTWEKPEGTR